MTSRQHHLQSHRYAARRLVDALVSGEADPVRPSRRSAPATLAGVLVAVLGLGGAAGYGAATGSAATDWRDSRVVIVERESGARYVYRAGRLHPVRNYSSALLIAGAAPPRTVLVRQAALRDVNRGSPLGIPDAPDSLPRPEDLVGPDWTVCSSVADQGESAAPGTSVLLGVGSSGGRPLGDDALLTRLPDGAVQLIWRGRRHAVAEPELVLAALGWTRHRPLPVAPAVLRALPVGADLARPTVPGAGQPSGTIPDTTVGEVFVMITQSGSRQYAVAYRDGLAEITQVQADLLLTAHDQAGPTRLTQGRFRGLPRVDELVPEGPQAPPAETPALRSAATGTVCVGGAGIRSQVRVAVDPDTPATGVRLPPGRGALVEAVRPGGNTPQVSLITDAGLRHPVPDPAVLPTLGYPDAARSRLPANVVELVPAGPDLDRRIALG
ncbi:type VII secretion protein EccB [Solwaraspora sp. WMMA2080]|uniref:type VII secretion protein EccB n=1 Tax=Solwaraspora sp. WMMA2080 TaxID=3015165 RepID=UPI00248BA459|nr:MULTISPECIES: type VII secretion protein EccB [unclassified Solwaraspora]WBB96572.1 type VII secretion protein EccB [Solwaraspora sp. WMMA2059]WBC19523.1 type VII secretion protein EccB [Solwaraspora sp. WMMA2080]WJK32893.1 type VII secretion protein EccB [Solwaraspora sp. WMMA2065]